MLDLEELGMKLDEALNKETPESLKSYLERKRMKYSAEASGTCQWCTRDYTPLYYLNDEFQELCFKCFKSFMNSQATIIWKPASKLPEKSGTYIVTRMIRNWTGKIKPMISEAYFNKKTGIWTQFMAKVSDHNPKYEILSWTEQIRPYVFPIKGLER